jgi:hypothetical protein
LRIQAERCDVIDFILRLSKPINQIQTEAAKNGKSLDNGRELQASWDRSLIMPTVIFTIGCSVSSYLDRVAIGAGLKRRASISNFPVLASTPRHPKR